MARAGGKDAAILPTHFLQRRRLGLGLPLLALPRLVRAQVAELRLLALLPLTGALAVRGDETCRGLELAAEEREGTPRFRVLRHDAPDAAAGVAELRRIAAGPDRPAAVFGSVSSAIAMAVIPAAEALGLPFFELSAVADGIGGRAAWRLGPQAQQYGAVAAGVMTRQVPSLLSLPVEALRVAILGGGGASADAICDAAEAALIAAGVAVAVRFAAPATEMGHAVQRLRNAGAELVLHSGNETDIAALFRAFREEGWHPRLVLGAGGGHAVLDTARAAGAGHDGTLVVDVPPVPPAALFTDAYRRRYGAPPRSGHSVAAYSLARPVLDALRAADPRSALAMVDLPEGTLANGWGLRFDARLQNLRAPPVLSRWENGALIAVASAIR